MCDLLYCFFSWLVICSLSLAKDKATNPSNRQEDWEYIIGFCDQINKELEGWVSQTALDLINYHSQFKVWNSIIKHLHFLLYILVSQGRAGYNREKMLPLLWKAAWLIQTEHWETGNSESASNFSFCSSRVLIWPKLFHLPVCKIGLSLIVLVRLCIFKILTGLSWGNLLAHSIPES